MALRSKNTILAGS